MKANYIVAGTQRAGTTSFHRMLRQNPAIDAPLKETHYFDQKYKAKNLDWYHDKFSDNGKLHGEKTPGYMYVKGCVKRIYEYNPGMKWIITLRDPVERAISYYQIEKKIRDLPFSEVFEQCKKRYAAPYDMLKRGLYAKQIKEILKYFPRNQVQILIYEKWTKHLNRAMKGTCKFLGIPRHNIKRLDLHKSTKRKISPEYRKKLIEYYRDSNIALYKDIFKKKIKHWQG